MGYGMKRIVFLLIVCTLICLCGCKIQSDSDDISPVRTDLSFDDTVDLCGIAIGLDIQAYCEDLEDNSHFSYEDYSIDFYRDYPAHLEEVTTPDDCGMIYYNPDESAYHILSGFSIDGFKVFVFDSSKWAMADYCRLANTEVQIEYEVAESSYNDGYYYTHYMLYNSEQFSAYYYLGDMIISYTYFFNAQDIENYQRYLDFCDALGLPTSDQITEEVMGRDH